MNAAKLGGNPHPKPSNHTEDLATRLDLASALAAVPCRHEALVSSAEGEDKDEPAGRRSGDGDLWQSPRHAALVMPLSSIASPPPAVLALDAKRRRAEEAEATRAEACAAADAAAAEERAKVRAEKAAVAAAYQADVYRRRAAKVEEQMRQAV